jgi:hypoxia up-regulated 1
MRELKRLDEAKKEKESEKNALETYLYSVRGKFSDLENELSTISTADQRDAILSLADKLEDWLYDEGEKASASEYRSKHNSIKELAEKIFLRLAEATDRPTVVTEAKATLKKQTDIVQEMEKSKPWVSERACALREALVSLCR